MPRGMLVTKHEAPRHTHRPAVPRYPVNVRSIIQGAVRNVDCAAPVTPSRQLAGAEGA